MKQKQNFQSTQKQKKNQSDVRQWNFRSSMKKSIRKKAPSPPGGSGTLQEESDDKSKSKPTAAGAAEAPKNKYSSGESSEEEEEDTRETEGNIFTKTGVEVDYLLFISSRIFWQNES